MTSYFRTASESESSSAADSDCEYFLLDISETTSDSDTSDASVLSECEEKLEKKAGVSRSETPEILEPPSKRPCTKLRRTESGPIHVAECREEVEGHGHHMLAK